MFKNRQFYHSTTKRAIVAFGTIFNNIQISRKDSAGVEVQSLRVPLAYSQKDKFLSRINAIPDADTRGEVAITLPRMGFEITGFQYDTTRKISPIRKNVSMSSTDSINANTSFVSTPYDIGMSLYVFAKNQEDALQIAEQIMPTFNPDFNITVNDLPEMGIKRDLKIILEGISYEDNYEGQYDARQSIIWTFNFVMKVNYYGFVDTQGLIRKAVATTWQNPELAGEYYRQSFEVGNTRATALATIAGGVVPDLQMQYAGDGYTFTPNVTIEGTATAVAVLEGPKIKKLILTNAGSGYSEAPIVVIEEPNRFKEIPGPADAYQFVEDFEQDYG